MEKLQYICGVTFAPFAPAGSFMKECAEESLRTMKERTNANFVILVPNGLQDTPQSEEICYTSPATMTDDELKRMIEYAHSLGLRVALKRLPTVRMEHGEHISVSLMRMLSVSRSGATGLLLIWSFRTITLRSHRKWAARCISRAARWSCRNTESASGDRRLQKYEKSLRDLSLIIRINIRNIM